MWIVVLFTYHALRLRHIILPNMACLAVPNSYTLHHKRHDFKGRNNHKIFASISSKTLFEIVTIKGNQTEDLWMYSISGFMEMSLINRTLMEHIFLERFSKNSQKIWRWVNLKPNWCFRKDEQKEDMTKQKVVVTFLRKRLNVHVQNILNSSHSKWWLGTVSVDDKWDIGYVFK